MTENKKKSYLSRSALAEQLSVTLKELTQTMIEAGWILQQDKEQGKDKSKEWRLTAKGEFEGGIYRESKKYGQYIVWPESVLSHPAIASVNETLISATTIGKAYSLPAKTINRLLAEVGWVTAVAKGWHLTALGKAYGGEQQHSDETGIPYVIWKRSLLDSSLFERQIKRYLGDQSYVPVVTINTVECANSEHDHRSLEGECYQSLNGAYIVNREELIIANWLYIYGLSYAYKRSMTLPKGETVLSDFYLPKENVHIHYNAVDIKPSELAQQLERQAVAKAYQLQRIELSPDDIKQLDSVLPKAFMQWDIALL